MANLKQFRDLVTKYRKPYQQAELATAIGLTSHELSHRLGGTGRSVLTQKNVLDIVVTLAQWQALTWEQAVGLLVIMDYPVKTNHLSWQAKLREHLDPPDPARSPTSKSTRTAVVPDALEESQLQPRRRLFQARDLPKDYVPRLSAFNAIKRLLLAHEENQATVITTALRGAGGFGKTTLASALCHDPDIQAAFPDGILWVELGEHPPQPLDVLNGKLQVLEPSVPGAISLEEARDRWRKALEKRAYLLVIDDVWQTEALGELLKEGPRCGRLVTTRNDQILPEDTKRVWVDAMEPEEAMALLCQGLVEDWPHTLERSVLERVVVQQLGCWPLLVSLARGTLTNQVTRLKKKPEQALALVEQAYKDRGMAAFYLGDRIERQRTADACVDVNLRQLEEWAPPHYQARQRYQELAVFPEDTNIPLSTLQTYWQGTGGLKAWEVEDLCFCLADLSLLLPLDMEHSTVRLHDVMRSYLIQSAGSHLPTFHSCLLDAYQQKYSLTRWADLSQSEEYLWRHLIFHLCQTGSRETLQTTLTDLSYLTCKALYVGISALEADLLLASTFPHSGDREPMPSFFTPLHRGVVRISHLLRQVHTLSEMGGIALSHLGREEPFAEQRHRLENTLPRPYLTSWHQLPVASSSALQRTLTGHKDGVNGCAVSPDGNWIVSASDDKTLKVWDASSGKEQLTLHGHIGPIWSCAVSPDGNWIVSASLDHTLKIWDASSGKEQLTLRGHIGPILGCAVSPDGNWIISISTDCTLKIWNKETHRYILTFPVDGWLKGCAFHPDGEHLVVCGEQGMYFLRLVV